MEDPKGRMDTEKGSIVLDEVDRQELCTDSGAKDAVPLVALKQKKKIDQNFRGKAVPSIRSCHEKKFDPIDVDVGIKEAVQPVSLVKKNDVPLESIERVLAPPFKTFSFLECFYFVHARSVYIFILVLVPKAGLFYDGCALLLI